MAFNGADMAINIKANADLNGFKKLDKAQKKAIGMNKSLGLSLRNMFAGIGTGAAIKSIVKATVTVDSLTRTFTALQGSAALGAEELTYLRETTDRLGISFVKTSRSYARFFAAAKSTGMGRKETRGVFESFMGTSRVLGMDAVSTEGMIIAVEQMLSKGKVSMEEIQRQMGNALPGAKQIAARSMGKTPEEFEKAVAAGMRADELTSNMAKQLNKEFGKDIPLAIQSLQSELFRLSNAWFNLKAEVFSGNKTESLAEFIREFTKTLKSPELLEGMNQIGKSLLFILKHSKELIQVLTALKGLELVSWFIKINTLMKANGIMSLFSGGGGKYSHLLTGLLKVKNLLTSIATLFAAKEFASAFGLLKYATVTLAKFAGYIYIIYNGFKLVIDYITGAKMPMWFEAITDLMGERLGSAMISADKWWRGVPQGNGTNGGKRINIQQPVINFTSTNADPAGVRNEFESFMIKKFNSLLEIN